MDECALTPDQKKACSSICDWFNSTERKVNYFKLGGLAGTGKTTLLNFVKEKLNIQSIGYAAYTGKAASVMRKKGIPANTIHSLIYKHEIIKNKVYFVRKPLAEVSYKLLIIDEASMVSEQIFKDLMSFNIPIIFCGDFGQLPPIEKGMGLMEEDKLDAKLTTICRQDEQSNIVLWSRKVRDGYKIPYCNKKDFVKIPFEEIDVEEFINADQVICGLNKNREYLNQSIREYLGFDSLYPSKGEKIIITDNNYKVGVFNGQIIIATSDMIPDKLSLLMPANCQNGSLDFCNEYELEEYLQKEKIIEENKKNSEQLDNILSLINEYKATENFFLFPFDNSINIGDLMSNDRKSFIISDFAYAITCHKAQGSEWPNVLVVDDWPRRRNDQSTRIKWLYTAITRASKRIVITDDFYIS